MRPVKRDYAPSRLRYRLARWWLSPRVRRTVTRWVPLGALAGIVGLVATDPANQAYAVERYQQTWAYIEARPEFAVTGVRIDGAGPVLSDRIRAALAVDLPASSLTLDLNAARDRVEALPPIASAQIAVGADRQLVVRVRARTPVAAWRRADGLWLLDAEGVVIGSLERRDLRSDLPLIVGRGAQRHVREALALAEAAGPLAARIEGVVRVGERRWDVVLDDDKRIMLPETGAVDALMHVLALQLSEEVMERDVAVFDMRNRARPTVRLGEHAVHEMRRLRAMESGEDA